MEREKEERMRREEARTEFSAEELALATIPGADFDPTRRQFSSDELRPQPIIRKRKKVLVTTLYRICRVDHILIFMSKCLSACI